MENSPMYTIIKQTLEPQGLDQSFVKFNFDEIQIVEVSFVLNITNNLGNGSCYQLQIF